MCSSYQIRTPKKQVVASDSSDSTESSPESEASEDDPFANLKGIVGSGSDSD